jgi:GNAT superfamily N-acetyltransferase/plasmid stability protein
MLELRRYEERDAAAVWRLHDEGLRQMGVHAGDGRWDDDLRSIVATYLDGGGEFLAGVIAGEIVAMGALRRVSSTVAELRRMRVDARVQRRGYGRALLLRLEARARELGYRTLRLDTTVKQHLAERLYRVAGRVAGVHALWVYRLPYMAKTIQVRDVPDDVHRRLAVRAAEERRSLSELVRAELIEIARRPTMAELLDRLASRPVTDLPESPADALAQERIGD